MVESPGGEWITVPTAAKLLGVALHTAYDLSDRGDMRADVSVPKHRPKQRRLVRLRRQDVYDYIERVRVKPGELHGLYPPLRGGKSRGAQPGEGGTSR